MYVKLINSMGSDLTIAQAARVSFNHIFSTWGIKTLNGYGNTTVAPETLSEKDQKLIRYLAEHQHYSCFEHNVMTLELKVPIFLSKQIMRHRTFSYNEVSRRYTSEDIEFYFPDWRKQSVSNRQASDGSHGIDALADLQLRRSYDLALETYNYLIERGIAREQARMVLPQSTYTRFIMTGSLRNWAHFVDLRIASGAQEEAQFVAREVKHIIEEIWPVSSAALFK